MATVTTWHWIFWVLSIADGVVFVVAVFLFRETHGATILHKKAIRLRKETGNPMLYTPHEREKGWNNLLTRLSRAITLLIFHPVIQIIALYNSLSFGILYTVLSSYPTLWQTIYGQNLSQTGLNYISIALGESIGSLVGAFCTDRIYAYFSKPKPTSSSRFTRKSKGMATTADTTTTQTSEPSEPLEPAKPKPEHRILLVIPGMLPIPIGLLWIGWSAQSHLHWIMPNIGALIFGIGASMGTVCTSAYIVDSFGEYTASAMAATRTLSFTAGFAFPLFALQLFQKLGWGGGMSLLAGLSLCLGITTPIVIWNWGAILRARGLYVGKL